jgi:antagonist of KipI
LNSIEIVKPGLLTTIQDKGRKGYQQYGISVSGVMDPFAHRIANILVGNGEDESTIEMTLQGPTIKFHCSAVISICGGDLMPEIDGNPVSNWSRIFIKKGSKVTFKGSKQGCRAYLAIAGGMEITKWLGSGSTYLKANIGGLHGMSLKKGDQIQLKQQYDINSQLKHVKTSSNFFHFNYDHQIRVIKGTQYHLFHDGSIEKFFNSKYEISPQSDRMGYRLLGEKLRLKKSHEMISEPVSIGTIQVPSDGMPILLMADRQTVGGYPKIANVISVDIPKLAQLKPGDKIQFKLISLKEAHRLLIEREKQIQILKAGLFVRDKGVKHESN